MDKIQKAHSSKGHLKWSFLLLIHCDMCTNENMQKKNFNAIKFQMRALVLSKWKNSAATNVS